MKVKQSQTLSVTKETRKIKDGGWYWVSKVVVRNYASRIGVYALAVYHILASMVNEQQQCFPSQGYVAKHLGCSRNTIHRAIKKLEDTHLITREKRNRYHCVYTLLDVSRNGGELQMSTGRASDVTHGDTNNTKVKRMNNDTLRSQKNNFFSSRHLITKEELLAMDIAQTLGEGNNLKVYSAYAHKYPESFLRQMLSEVKRTPNCKIKKSRGALFAYLIRHYGDTQS